MIGKQAQQRKAAAIEWVNHYSPKYNRCFVVASYMPDAKNSVKGGPLFSTILIDAFERATLVTSATGPSPEILCRNEEKPESCIEAARIMWRFVCSIGKGNTDCVKSGQFIEDHMKN